LDGPWAVLFAKIAPSPRVIFWPTYFRQKSQAFTRSFALPVATVVGGAKQDRPTEMNPEATRDSILGKNTKIKTSTGSNTRRFVQAKSTPIPFFEFSAAHTP
jgi:hypothetical protein